MSGEGGPPPETVEGMAENRRQLNDQWCEFHWAPYRDPSVNGILGATSLMQAILDNAEFMADAAKLRAKGVERNLAAQRTMERWVSEKRKPMCCLLGDDVMAKILIAASRDARH